MAQQKNPIPEQTVVGKGVRRLLGLVAAGILVYAAIFLFMQQQVQASEVTVSGGITVETAAEPADPLPVAEHEEPSRLKQAFGFLFDGDATAIVAEYERALAAKAQELDERAAAIAEREVELSDAEASVAQAKDETSTYRDAIKAKHDALTACVLKAMGGDQ